MTELYRIALYFGGFCAATFFSIPIVEKILRPFEESADEMGGLERAGKLIGILERVIVVLLVFVDAYGAIGFLFAAKSIARFQRLKEREVAEYYLVGTLISIALGLAFGLLTKYGVGFLPS